MKRKLIPTGVGYIDTNLYLSFNGFKILIHTVLDEVVNHHKTIEDEESMHLIFFQNEGLDMIYKNQTYSDLSESFLLYGPRVSRTEHVHKDPVKKYHIIFNVIPNKSKHVEKTTEDFQEESDFFLNYFLQEDYFTVVKDRTHLAAPILKRIVTEFKTMKFGYYFVICSLFTELFSIFFRNLNAKTYSLPEYLEPKTLILISNYISHFMSIHYQTTNLREVASHFHMSERQIQRHVYKVHKVSFTSRLNEIRIEKASKFLLNTNDSIARIAEEVGFQTPSHFFKIFKKIHKISPLQFRKRAGECK